MVTIDTESIGFLGLRAQDLDVSETAAEIFDYGHVHCCMFVKLSLAPEFCPFVV